MQTDLLYTIISIPLLALITFLLIKRYSSPLITNFTFLIAFFSWMVCFSFFAIFPIDIYLSNSLDEKNNKEGNEYKGSMRMYWRVIYWTMFMLSCIVMPVLRYYYESGEFNFRGKLRDSLMLNLIWDGIGLVIAGGYGGWVYSEGQVRNL